MKPFLLLIFLTGILSSCTEHVYTHRSTTTWETENAPSPPVPSPSSPSAQIQPYTPEVVDPVRAQ